MSEKNTESRWLYIDATAGMSGNMFMAAAIDLLKEMKRPDLIESWKKAVAALGLPDVEVDLKRVLKCGVGALHAEVIHHEHHAHRGLSDVLGVIDRAKLPAGTVRLARKIFERLALAEAEVHQVSVEEIHFHEVGAVDAIVDVMSAAFLFEALNVDKVFCSEIRTGHGFVTCAHGDMPIPAPATARLLKGKPCFAGEVKGEWLTPTGAAILHAVVDEYGPQPLMRISDVGIGAGTKDAPHPNAIRLFLGENAQQQTSPAVESNSEDATTTEVLVELETHVDDMTGEDLGALSQILLNGPALDVTVLSGVGKKNRPQFIVKVLLPAHEEARGLQMLFAHSTTFGVRVLPVKRVALSRKIEEVETQYGLVRVKVHPKNTAATGVIFKVHPEFEDCFSLAEKAGVSVGTVRDAAAAAFAKRQVHRHAQ